MGPVRSLRRNTSPLTILVGFALCLFILFFLFSPSGVDSALQQSREDKAASNPLSPPTQAFRKSTAKGNGKRVPPPVIHYHLNNVTTTSDPIGNRETILILTPLARFYQQYWDNLLALTFPHDLITLGFIIPKNKEGNAAYTQLQEQISKTQKGPEKKRFASIIVERQDFDPPLSSQDEQERHKMENQKARRASMSRARNSLLFTTLGPATSWVFWLDSDIIETPPTIIQDLASHDKPIIVPNCYQRYLNSKTNTMDERPYDFNSWQDSATARSLGDKLGPDDILLEGYAEMATYRTLMAYMSNNGDRNDEINLDGVGGTALLVKADVHRDGAMFPPFPFYHLIETEGFARMAKRLGWSSTGLPNYKVRNSHILLNFVPWKLIRFFSRTIRYTITTNKNSISYA